jgi:hypothetical protein
MMRLLRTRLCQFALIAAGAGSSLAWATLPAPTPAQQQAAAAKKAAGEADAAKQKEQLAASMDALSTRWRARAASQGWKTNAPVALAAAPVAGAAVPGTPGAVAPGAGSQAVGASAAGAPAPSPSATSATVGLPLSGAVPQAVQTTGVAITGRRVPGVSPQATGVSATMITGTPAGKAASAPGNGAAPLSPQALQSANVPIKSEKLGTASPSPDAKDAPSQKVPHGVSPAVDKGNSKEVKH